MTERGGAGPYPELQSSPPLTPYLWSAFWTHRDTQNSWETDGMEEKRDCNASTSQRSDERRQI